MCIIASVIPYVTGQTWYSQVTWYVITFVLSTENFSSPHLSRICMVYLTFPQHYKYFSHLYVLTHSFSVLYVFSSLKLCIPNTLTFITIEDECLSWLKMVYMFQPLLWVMVAYWKNILEFLFRWIKNYILHNFYLHTLVIVSNINQGEANSIQKWYFL